MKNLTGSFNELFENFDKNSNFHILIIGIFKIFCKTNAKNSRITPVKWFPGRSGPDHSSHRSIITFGTVKFLNIQFFRDAFLILKIPLIS